MLHGKGLEQFMRGWRKITGDFLFAFAGGGVESPRGGWFLGSGAARLMSNLQGGGLAERTH